MAVRPVSTLKGWFVTFAKPVQAQFWDWLDSFRHKDDKIGTLDLDPALVDLISSLPSQAAIDQLLQELDGKADLDGTGHLTEAQWPSILIPQTTTISANGSYTIPAGRLLDKIVVIPTADVTFSIGTSPGGQNIQPPLLYTGGNAEVLVLALYANGADRIIYFTGINSNTTLKFYTR